MYFSATELYNHRTNAANNGYGMRRSDFDDMVRRGLRLPGGTAVTLAHYRQFLRATKTVIANRNTSGPGDQYLGKWLRPWDIVEKLKNFQAPEGDFGVGFEVELGFRTLEAARTVARHVSNWQHITLDFEGGNNPIELTFPPKPYSKLGKRSQVIRYLDYLKANSNLVTAHSPGTTAGTHVNVSLGGGRRIDGPRLQRCIEMMQRICGYNLNYSYNGLWNSQTTAQRDLCTKYFGRRPYGWGYSQAGGKWVEWKLFHSTIDSARFRQYVDVAVAITALIGSRDVINETSVLAALESGWSKSLPKSKKATASVAPNVALAA